MTKLRTKFLLAAFTLLLAALPQTASAAPGWIGRTMDSVVVVRSQGETGRVTGSGFVVSDQLVATAAHLIRPGEIEVLLSNPGGELRRLEAEARRQDPVQDMALLEVAGDLPPPLPLSGATPEGGDEIWSVAAELIGDRIVHTAAGGTVDSLRDGMLVHDAGQRPGFSGAPLLSADGLLVGMTRQTVAGDLSAGPGLSALTRLVEGGLSGGPPGTQGKFSVEPVDPESILPPLSEAFPNLSAPDLSGAEWEMARGRTGYRLPWTPTFYDLSRTSEERYELTWRDLELEPTSRLLPRIAVEVVRSEVEFDQFVENYTQRFLLERGFVEMDRGSYQGLNSAFSQVVTGRGREGYFQERLVAFSEAGEGVVHIVVFTYPWFSETSETVDTIIRSTLHSFDPGGDAE